MVRQLAAFTNVKRWHEAQGDNVNLEKTALALCRDGTNYIRYKVISPYGQKTSCGPSQPGR